jgi:modulator of FtsH protease HflC
VQGDENLARVRLTQAVNGSLREEFGKRTIHEVVSGEREKIMDLMRERADQIAREIGVQVLDVRLKRVDFTPEISESVYGRMQAERKRVANELRSTGFAEAEKIRAEADKQRQVVVAQAYRDAQRLKGDGDAKASAIYARVFERNPEFYAFYRSLEAYRQSFKNKGDLLILEPNSEFFKYLKNPAGRAK